MNDQELPYLRQLSMRFPSVLAASTAIIKLNAELMLPKGTEHFISDIHGEYETFCHVLRNASGAIECTVNDIFGDTLSSLEQRKLLTLIYYPQRKIPVALQTVDCEDKWLRNSLHQLVAICGAYSSRYTRAQVRRFMPDHFAPIIEELLYRKVYRQEAVEDQSGTCQSIIDSIVATASAADFIVALAELIQRLAIARLHIIGDIYDRGPGAHQIMAVLLDYHSVDIQWGNHDILWMAAAAGSEACMANVIRISLRYANLETLENGYGVSLLPLASFAVDTYGEDPCARFAAKVLDGEGANEQELRLMAQMHKAITIIQLKLEGQVIDRRPQYQMDDRLVLSKIDYQHGTIVLDGAEYPLLDTHFPTIDPGNPYQLTAEESSVVEKLKLSFLNSRELQRHVQFLYSNGSMYLVHNGHLLYHGCIAMNEDSSFKAFKVCGEEFSGKSFMDRVDRLARQGYFSSDDWEQKSYGMDAMWYLWCGAESPLFGKEKMATFERHFVADKTTHKEARNAYYDLRHSEATIEKILEEFGLNPDTGRVVNGHVPVRVKMGESPVKANGKLVVIDGGFSRAYQNQTGIAGYTLVYDADGLQLVAHKPFESAGNSVEDPHPGGAVIKCLETKCPPLRVGDTDEGREIQSKIDHLQKLLEAFRGGLIKEHQQW